MTPTRWKQIEELYHAALSVPPHARSILLARACAGDDELRREVESLLAADARAAETFLQSGVATLGMQLLAADETQRMTMKPTVTMKLNDRYELLDELGSGGMGKVYQARDTHVGGRPVVVKLLQEKWLQHEWVVTKFKQEATALARIDDPGVVGILDAGALPDGQPWLVLQFVEGRELSDHIRSGGMELADVAEIIKQIGRTLTTAHDAGVIHRDLKPANIMVRRNTSGDWQVKIIDFGIAKVLNDSAQAADAATRFQVGTPLYMSPEQRKGKPVTPGNDVYALGLIGYEMLTGARPFNPADPQELDALQQSGLKVKPSDLRPGLAKAVDDALNAALAYDAAKRPTSARAFGDALAQALTPQPPPHPTPKSMDKRWLAAVAVAGVLAVCLLAALWWNFASQTLAREQMIDNLIANSPTAAAAPANGPVYDAEAAFSTGPPPQGMVYATIGFTVWRTRPATARDGADAARETIDSQEMAAERIADTIADGDRIYLGVESLTGDFLPDKGGYLYVINREQYADGTLGRARLIFPTLRTYAGANRVKPGQPIVLPETNRPFVIRRSSPAQVAESYTVILSPWQFQLPEPLGEKAMVLPDNLVADWEKQYGGRMQRATLRGGVGQVRTMREFAVGSRGTFDTAESLTTNDPLPQTSFRRTVKNGDPAMVTVALRFRD